MWYLFRILNVLRNSKMCCDCAHFLAFGTTSVQSSFPKLITRNDGSLRLYRNFISNLSATEFQFPTLATNTFEDRFM
ncbi:hypothetical protein RIR_jg28005.t1 [Rhizophagus irregularis DAOM 181602=DAOM 197198]|nr:hypothetical protein RIR_jg28005.t1 [Rhizophagus irregularis DAOM 181602=DAOM 197198]